MNNQELEVKFYIGELAAIEAKLRESGAQIIQPRTFEVNLRFDTPEGSLSNSYRVLRLRKDTASRMTYKGPASSYGGARLREEIEFIVSDFDTAKLFLEALGYRVSMVYEKYRAIFELAGVQIMLDELPYGDFVELEGPDPASLRWVNHKLQLDWQAQVPASYAVLFDSLKAELGFSFRDLTFENFNDLQITAGMLRVRQAEMVDPDQSDDQLQAKDDSI
jgi:adenylate cyclase class 2